MGSLMMVFAHFMQLLIPDCLDGCKISLAPLFMLGISYSTYAVAQWGALPNIVDKKALGTAFGIVNVFENIGTVVAPPILGWIETNTKNHMHGYFWVEIFFVAVAIISLGFNLLSMRPISKPFDGDNFIDEMENV